MAARPGFCFCVCPDSRLIRGRVEDALAGNPPAGGGAWERHAFWGDEPLPPACWEHLTLQGLFSAPKALVVHNAQNLPAETWQRLSAALASDPGDAWPFFSLSVLFEKGGPKIPAHITRQPCWIFAGKQGWIWTSPGLTPATRTEFIRSEARRLRVRFAPGALEALGARLPLDAAAIGVEMDKLALGADADGVIGIHLAELVDFEPEPDIFSLLRTVQQGGNAMAAWRQTLAKRGTDSVLFAFLAVLTREARQLWQLLAGESVRLPPSILPAKTSLAQSLGKPGVAVLWQLALEAEKSVKSGERDVDQAMEGLMAGLFALFGRR
jgi:DNA polymerase-3 subunit delta